MPVILVIIPTYNEKGNLLLIIERIMNLGLKGISVLVVDDNSPDGTGELAERLKSKYPLEVMHRPKKSGFGTAYRDAFEAALAKPAGLRPEFIIQMDADLSHDPILIPKFIEKMRDCDIILGSRYIKGGTVKNWSWWRKALSRFANFYSRTLLALPYRDITGGYKCFRREVLEAVHAESISSVGYSFQVEITYRAHKLGFRICEQPITFTERKTGFSKLDLSIVFESFLKVLALRFSKLPPQLGR